MTHVMYGWIFSRTDKSSIRLDYVKEIKEKLGGTSPLLGQRSAMDERGCCKGRSVRRRKDRDKH